MRSALNPLTEHLECEQCHGALRDRIKDVVAQWASVGVSAALILTCHGRSDSVRRCGLHFLSSISLIVSFVDRLTSCPSPISNMLFHFYLAHHLTRTGTGTGFRKAIDYLNVLSFSIRYTLLATADTRPNPCTWMDNGMFSRTRSRVWDFMGFRYHTRATGL